MSEQIDWSKAPEGATHYFPSTEEWYLAGNGCAPLVWTGMWCKAFQFARREHKCIKRPATQSWSGEGLPPVGAVCDVKQMARGAEREWFKAKVLYSSPYTVVLDDYQDGEFVSHPCTLQFRPIRTPEQIAADEREAAVDEMHKLYMEGAKHSGGLYALYDAGYRKP